MENNLEEESADLDANLLEKLSFILSGKNRIKVCSSLFGGLKTATELQEENKVALSSICRSLNELKDKDIVFCVNEDLQNIKLYKVHPDIQKLKRIIQKRRDKFKE